MTRLQKRWQGTWKDSWAIQNPASNINIHLMRPQSALPQPSAILPDQKIPPLWPMPHSSADLLHPNLSVMQGQKSGSFLRVFALGSFVLVWLFCSLDCKEWTLLFCEDQTAKLGAPRRNSIGAHEISCAWARRVMRTTQPACAHTQMRRRRLVRERILTEEINRCINNGWPGAPHLSQLRHNRRILVSTFYLVGKISFGQCKKFNLIAS